MVTRAVLALVVATGLLLAGCTDGDEPDSDPTNSSTPAPSTTQPTSPAATDSSDGSTTEPATGPLVEDDLFTFHLPADAEWELARGGFTATTYDEDFNPFDVATSVVPGLEGGTGDPLDADYELSTDQDPYDLKRGENRVLDGVEGWTARSVEKGQLIYEFGTVHQGQSFSITFSFPEKDPRTLEWIEATLASLTWK